MAKIFITGNVFVIKSTISLEKLKLLEKYRPEALKLKNEEGEAIFGVGTGSSNISKNGASFKEATLDEAKLACMTLPFPAGTENAKECVKDFLGLSFLNLQKVERGYEAALRGIEDDMALIEENIAFDSESGDDAGEFIDTESAGDDE